MTETQLLLLERHVREHQNSEMLWLIDQVKKVKPMQETLQYIVDADFKGHYGSNGEHMLNDFKGMAELALVGK